MAKLTVKKDDTSRREYIFVLDSASTTGAGKTGIAYNAGGIKAYYVRPGGSATAISLKTQTVTGSYDSGGWVEVDSTNMPGVYRFDIPNAVFATGVDKAVVMVSGASGMAPVVLEYDLVGYDPGDSVRLGLTALPNNAANASGGLITNGTSTGQLNVSNGNITVGGYAANQAPLQPTVSGRTLDVSVNGEAGIDWANIGSPSTTVNFSGSTIKTVTDTVSANTIQLDSKTVSASTGVTFPASVGTSTLTAANVWDTDISGYTTAGYAGTYLKNASAPSAATVADAVWDEVLSGHLTSGSTGAALNAAGSSGDPWATALPGSYGAGTAGKIIGDNINATIGSRLASSDITLNSGAVTVGTNNDKTAYSLSQSFPANFSALAIAPGTGTVSLAATPPTANNIADAVWGANITNNSTGSAWSASTMGRRVYRSSTDSVATEAQIADAVWDEPRNDHDTGNTTGHSLDQIRKANYTTAGTVNSTTGATTTSFRTNLTGVNGTFDHQTILFINSFALNGQSAPILSYAQTNGVITLGDALTVAPSLNDEFVILPTHVYPMSYMVSNILAGDTSTTTYAAGDVGNVLARLHNMIQTTGADFQFDATALALAPTGGGGGGSTIAAGNVPYQLRADTQYPDGAVDVYVGTLLRLDMQVQDRDGNAIDLTGATVTVGVRNASTGATVGTDQSATLSLARLGMIYVDTVADWSATAGTYRITVSATVGTDVIIAGPLPLIVRSR